MLVPLRPEPRITQFRIAVPSGDGRTLCAPVLSLALTGVPLFYPTHHIRRHPPFGPFTPQAIRRADEYAAEPLGLVFDPFQGPYIQRFVLQPYAFTVSHS